MGNILRGVPVAPDGEWAGTFLGLLNPYSILVGLVSASFFVLHGALYLRLKTEGALAERLGRWIPRLWIAFAAIYSLATAASVVTSPFLFEGVLANPLFLILTALLLAALIAVPLFHRAVRPGYAFLASSTTVLAAILVAAVSLFPRLVPSSLGLANSLTIYNAASSHLTQTVMLIIALVGVPIVLAYTAFIYWIFRGKVRLDDGIYGGGPAR